MDRVQEITTCACHSYNLPEHNLDEGGCGEASQGGWDDATISLLAMASILSKDRPDSRMIRVTDRLLI